MEAVVTYFRIIFVHLPGETGKPRKTPVRIAGNPFEFGSRYSGLEITVRPTSLD
jgi:hypothetical protein